MNVLSLFAGVGGFDLGFERAGMEIIAQCEFEAHAQSVLKRHWPDVPLVSDVKDLRGADYPADVVVGGFPCQDVSVAGRREGLAGERSGLFFQAVRVIEEMQEATQGEFPKYVVIENVPGLFSSRKGADFRAVIQTLIQAEVPMPRSGKWAYAGMVRSGERQLAWRTLDSQHWGVAQRRRRVFLVLGLGGRSAAQILFEREGLSGHPAPGREAGQDIAGTLEARTRGGGFPGTDGAISGHIVPQIANALTAREGKGPDSDATTTLVGQPVAPSEIHPSLNAAHGGKDTGPAGLVPVGFNWQNGGNESLAMRVDGVGPLDTSQTKAIAFGIYDEQTPKVGEEVMPTLRSRHTGGGSMQSVAFAQNSRNELRLENGDGQKTDALSTGGGKPGQGYKAIAFAMRGRDAGNVPEASGDQVNALRGSSGGSTRDMVATHYAVRRLMPVETERLQAMPDDWTRYAADGKEIADTHRYRMVGNAVTVSVVEWLGHRVAAALSVERELKEAA